MANLTMQSYKIVPGLYLNKFGVVQEQVTQVTVKEPIHNIFCCDISGSMWDELPQMRTQLKNRIASIVGEEDTITIIAFAGRHDCFVLKEKVHVNNPKELNELHKAIDKYLRPMGCTDFVQPCVATKAVVAEPGYYNWVFLSDGGHNESSFTNVVDALEDIKDSISQATIIEYGYYADSRRLSQMAELLSGTKIPAADFDSYTPIMESVFTGGSCVAKNEYDIPFNVDTTLVQPLFIYVNPTTNNVHVAAAQDGKVQLPTNVTEFYSLSNHVVGTDMVNKKLDDTTPLYAVAYVLADKLEYDLAEDVLNMTGDTKFISMYQTSFGKQKLFQFQNELGEAVGDTAKRGKIDPNYKPVDNNYCVIDFFNELSADPKNLIKITDPAFSYKRTSAKTVDKIELTDEEQAALQSAKTAAAIEKIMTAAKARQVKMTMVNKGYPITDFVWNEDRANLNGLFKIDVELELPANNVGLSKVSSFVWRNYTIIKDGIVNITTLPMTISNETYAALQSRDSVKISDVQKSSNGTVDCIIDISAVPVLNKKKVQGCKKSELTKLALALTDCKFALKYLGSIKKQYEKDVEVLGEAFGYTQEQADYLASLGITAKGYSPKKETEKEGDFYMATTLNSTFKSFSSIPKIEDLDKKRKAGKNFTPSEQYLDAVINNINTTVLSKFKEGTKEYEEAVKKVFADITAEKNKYQAEIAQMKFALLVSRKWFVDAKDFDDNMDTIKSGYGLEMTMEYKFGDKKQSL